ncbi:MAG: YraN family protein [Holophagales bacterium]|nr:MAG: YraN family protein [Holophagales bacterium]
MSGSLPEFERQPHRRAKGGVAETEAASYLERCGFRILARNVVTHAGEIDLVASEGETLCFVEVKARASARFGPAIAAIGREKQRRLARAASLYLLRHPWSGPCRFDALGLDAGPHGWTITLVRDAFQVAATS